MLLCLNIQRTASLGHGSMSGLHLAASEAQMSVFCCSWLLEACVHADAHERSVGPGCEPLCVVAGIVVPLGGVVVGVDWDDVAVSSWLALHVDVPALAGLIAAPSCRARTRLPASDLAPRLGSGRSLVTGGAHCVAHQHAGLLHHLGSVCCGRVSPALAVGWRAGKKGVRCS